ncbi:MAG: 1,4-dihydroxy-2-naphthoate octaprenyltransferase [Verrucomicrobiota bacterium JB023]|nr:1,4-dihydroxy-2-naphthoate octaprenyltransferase [Verrucomicrobiota bacterium JB023]
MLKPILLASRPKTLPAAIVPVWAGCVLAWKLTGQFSWVLALCTLGSAIAIQIATNFFNDALDHDKGADTDKRLGPIRATASGLLSRKVVYSLATGFLGVAVLLSLPLIQERGLAIIAIGLPSLFLAYGYTGGPFPLAYLGLGEIFVILFFGLIAVMGTVFVQTGQLFPEAFWLGLVVGSLSAVLITINNLRDVEEDAQSQKRTLAVRFGWKKGRHLLLVEYLLAILGLSFCLHSLGFTTLGLPAILILIVLPSYYFRSAVKTTPPSPRYNKFLALAGLHLVAFAAAFHGLLAL